MAEHTIGTQEEWRAARSELAKLTNLGELVDLLHTAATQAAQPRA